jgi:uncharacterized damage-inducible protein DinB
VSREGLQTSTLSPATTGVESGSLRIEHDEPIFQVTSHSTYHRGQVNARVREGGRRMPLVDFIAWVWFGKPDPARQEAA